MNYKIKAAAASLALLLAASLAGCGAAPASQPAGVASNGSGSGSYAGYRNFRWNNKDVEKYTKADYELALSFKTEGYENLTVDEFARKVMDPENEAAYHKTEEALQRLSYSLKDDDPNGAFIFGPLFTTWNECEKQHYNKCAEASAPWHSSYAQYETYGNVFGDTVTLTGAYLDFDFNYTISDPKTLTVGQRQQLMRDLETGLENFLKQQPQKELAKTEAMEKTLKAELERQLKALSGGITWAGQSSLGYWWSGPDEDDETWQDTVISGTASANEEDFPDHYTKAQYELVLEKLRFADYKSLSIAEFARLVNRVLYDYNDEEGEAFMKAYEIVMCYLPETDPAYSFLTDTVETSRKEYSCREKEVYSGKTCDPEIYQYISHQVQEDVFGDKVAVGSAEGSYYFTYRILKEQALTVEERDAFLAAVRQGVEAFVQASTEKELTKSQFKAGIEAAGKAAGNTNIQFTGCRVESYDVWR